MTAGPGGARHGGVDHGAVSGRAGDIHIANSFTGQGQGLRIRVADDGVPVDGGQEGHFHAVSQLPVRLVGDQVDGMTEGRGFFCQQRRQSGEGLPGVHHAGGVVGRVENDGLGGGGQHFRQSRHIDLKIRHVRGNHLEGESCFLGKGLVFREVRGHRQQLPTGNCQRPEHADQLRGRAAAKEEFLGPGGHAVPGVEVIGNGLPGFEIAYGGGVAVNQKRIRLIQNLMDCFVHFLRRGDGGVAERIVVDIFRADNGGPLTAVFK